MHNLSWRNISLKTEEHRVTIAGGHQLELRRCYRDEPGIPVVMLAGFLFDSSIFFPTEPEAGLGPYLAAQGFDVYALELRGKGRSWPAVNHNSKTGLHHAIVEDIPAHLKQIAKLRPDQPQIWIGQGLGSVLLSACYGRMDTLPSPLMGMVHFSAGRYHELDTARKTFKYMLWGWRCSLSRLLLGYVIPGMGEQTDPESSKSYLDWKGWNQTVDWLDPVDQFNYRKAIREKGMPPSLYFAAQNQNLWGALDNSRLWIQEVGNHDARLVSLGKACGNSRNYSQRSMLDSPNACSDYFEELVQWLHQRQATWKQATWEGDLPEDHVAKNLQTQTIKNQGDTEIELSPADAVETQSPKMAAI